MAPIFWNIRFLFDQLNRYLALWHMADLDYESGLLYMVGTTTAMSAADYATVFAANKKTPYAAIPLANHYDTTTGTSSLKIPALWYAISATVLPK